MRRPTKLMSGCSSCGIITLSCTRMMGGLDTTRRYILYTSTDTRTEHINNDILVVGRRLEVGVDLMHACDEAMSFLLQLAPRPVLARVEALTVRRVDGLRRRRPSTHTLHTVHCTLYTLHSIHCIHCTVYTVHSALYSIHCIILHTLYSIHCTYCTAYTVHNAQYTLYLQHGIHCTYCTVYTVQTAQYTLYIPHSIHCTYCTALYTLYTLHSIHCTHCTVYCTAYTVHTAQYTPYTLHSYPTLYSPSADHRQFRTMTFWPSKVLKYISCGAYKFLNS